MTTATLTNADLRIQAGVPPNGEQNRRRRSIHSSPNIDARHINVVIANGRATVTGTVRTQLVRNAVAEAVTDAPGVTEVDNRLLVEDPYVGPPDPVY